MGGSSFKPTKITSMDREVAAVSEAVLSDTDVGGFLLMMNEK